MTLATFVTEKEKASRRSIGKRRVWLLIASTVMTTRGWLTPKNLLPRYRLLSDLRSVRESLIQCKARMEEVSSSNPDVGSPRAAADQVRAVIDLARLPDMETFVMDAYVYRFLITVLETQYTHAREREAAKAEQEKRMKALLNDLREQEPMHKLACTEVSICRLNFSDIRSRVECALDRSKPLETLFAAYAFNATILNSELSPVEFEALSMGSQEQGSTKSPDKSFKGRMKSRLFDMPLTENSTKDPSPVHIEHASTMDEPKSPSSGDFVQTLRLATRPSMPSLRPVSSWQSLRPSLHRQWSFASTATTLVEDPQPRSLRSMLSRHRLNTSGDDRNSSQTHRLKHLRQK